MTVSVQLSAPATPQPAVRVQGAQARSEDGATGAADTFEKLASARGKEATTAHREHATTKEAGTQDAGAGQSDADGETVKSSSLSDRLALWRQGFSDTANENAEANSDEEATTAKHGKKAKGPTDDHVADDKPTLADTQTISQPIETKTETGKGKPREDATKAVAEQPARDAIADASVAAGKSDPDAIATVVTAVADAQAGATDNSPNAADTKRGRADPVEPAHQKADAKAQSPRVEPQPVLRQDQTGEKGSDQPGGQASGQGNAHDGESRADASASRQTETPRTATGEPRVTVVSSTSTASAQPALAQAAVSPTTAALVENLGRNDAWRTMTQAVAATQDAPQAASGSAMRTLEIQLHPLHLGTVEARLTRSGDALSVELRVHNTEAYQRLSTDSNAIVKSMQGLGLEIDRVTVQHVPAPSHTGSQGGQHQTGQQQTGRDGGFSMGGGRDETSGGGSRNADGGRGGNDRGNGGTAQDRADAGRSGVYI